MLAQTEERTDLQRPGVIPLTTSPGVGTMTTWNAASSAPVN